VTWEVSPTIQLLIGANVASPVKDLGPDSVLPVGDFWLGVMGVSVWIILLCV
jgi:hypothetical protein